MYLLVERVSKASFLGRALDILMNSGGANWLARNG